MAEKENRESTGAGKFIVIEKIKNKYSDIIAGSNLKQPPVTSSTLFLEGIHFSLVYFPLLHLGYKAVVSSISGIYAKGGIPESLTVNLGISTRHRIEDIEEIFQGVQFACRRYSLLLTDLHVDSSLTGLTIAVHSTGQTAALITETAPGENDLICVTGNLGAAYMGLNILERERKVFEETGGAQPVLEGNEVVIARQLKPDLSVNLLDDMAEAGIKITSLMVTTEGISSDMIGSCRKLHRGCRIYADKIPVADETRRAAEEFGIEPVIATLNGGDDYEFLFTVPITDIKKINAIEGITVIGHITAEGDGCNLVLQDGSITTLRAPGWEGEGS